MYNTTRLEYDIKQYGSGTNYNHMQHMTLFTKWWTSLQWTWVLDTG